MNLKSIIAIAALASTMALPLSASAQGRGHNKDHRAGARASRPEGRSEVSGKSHRNDRWNQDNDRKNDRRQNGRGSEASGKNHRNERWNQDNDRRSDDRRRDDDRREENRWDRNNQDRSWDYGGGHSFSRGSSHQNEWRDIAIAAGAVGIIGLLEHDNFLTFSGAVGSLYAISRYDNDRRCDDPYRRARAAYFSKPFFYRNDHRYERHVVSRNGARYYQFVRCD